MRIRETLSKEEGAEVLEFALVFPVAAFLIFGLIYGLVAVAAHVSLAHAVSRGARYASIPTDPVSNTYPTVDDVESHIDGHTPFFSASSCEIQVTGEARENAPVLLDAQCEFPNPLGAVLSGLQNLITRGDGPGESSNSLVMSARAESRRE